MIKLIDFMSLFTDDTQKVILYSLSNQEEVYLGCIRGIPKEYEQYVVREIETLHQPSKALTLNIISKYEEV